MTDSPVNPAAGGSIEEIDALLALDALPPDEQADAELRIGLVPSHLGVATLLAEETVTVPPADLRADVLARATSHRQPGRPVDAVLPCAPDVAFDRTVEDLKRLLDSLTDQDWNAAAHADHGRVRDLVAHLVGVERLVSRWLDPDDEVEDLPDHVQATRPVIEELAGADPHDIARQWYEAARAVAAASTGDRSRYVTFHDLTMTVDQLLVMRTGELWSHAIDISEAVGRPLPVMDPERMATLSTALMTSVPVALTYQGTDVPGRAVRFVLTGPSGGTFTVPLAIEAPTADPGVTIIADTVRFCRVAINRLRPDELDGVIDGDRELADLVLAGVGALARD